MALGLLRDPRFPQKPLKFNKYLILLLPRLGGVRLTLKKKKKGFQVSFLSWVTI